MPFEPLRFIHAANLQLDHPLRIAAPISPDRRELAEDATLVAFERLIDAGIGQQVDFLLLTGNSFVEQDRSLRARMALARGFARLDEHGIQVFAVPGEMDPLSAWRSLDGLPQNVTLLPLDAGEPLAVLRDGHVIATIAPVTNQATEGSQQSAAIGSRGSESRVPNSEFRTPLPLPRRTAPFAIGLSESFDNGLVQPALDYVAVVGAGEGRTDRWKQRIVHHPGGTQAMSPDDAGPHGGTLVHVGSDMSVDCLHLPTSVELEELESGHDSGIRSQNSEGRDRNSEFRVPSSEFGLAAEYDQHLASIAATAETLQHVLDAAQLPEGPWSSRLAGLVEELDAAAVVRSARRRGMDWFSAIEQEGSST